MAVRLRTETTNGRPQRFLVAGAAGFIGSHLVDRLLAQGHDVVGVDNFLTGTPLNLASVLDHPHFKFLEHDVVRPLRMSGRIDWILHFASPASPPKYQQHPIHTLRSNAEGAFQLLELARARGARLLFASTSEVYGDPDRHPQAEDYWGHVNPTGPRSMYDEGKRYAEAMITHYHHSHGLSTRLIRIFNTYGPRMRQDDGRVIVNFIRQALVGEPLTVYGDGSQTRSFQYIDDLLDGVERVLRVDYAGPINLGNPEEYTMLELADVVRELTQSRSGVAHEPLPQDDPKRRRPDIALAERLLGWRPRAPLREGLASTIRYFRGALGLERERVAAVRPRVRVVPRRPLPVPLHGSAVPGLSAVRPLGGSP